MEWFKVFLKGEKRFLECVHGDAGTTLEGKGGETNSSAGLAICNSIREGLRW